VAAIKVDRCVRYGFTPKGPEGLPTRTGAGQALAGGARRQHGRNLLWGREFKGSRKERIE
jgi:hypothetical protein